MDMTVDLCFEVRNVFLSIDRPLDLANTVFQAIGAAAEFETGLILLNLCQEC